MEFKAPFICGGNMIVNMMNINEKYPWIDSIEWNVDKENDGTPIHICWFKVPYVSLMSECSYFHFSCVEEFNKWVTKVRLITEEDIQRGDISGDNYDVDFLEKNDLDIWLYRYKNRVIEDCAKILNYDGINSKLIVRDLLNTLAHEKIYFLG